MKPNFKYFVLAGFFMIALIGWWRAGVKVANIPMVPDAWDQLVAAGQSPPDYAALAETIKASGIFPPAAVLPGEEEDEGGIASAEQLANQQNGIPLFPKIVGVSNIDDTLMVLLLLPDQSIFPARVGSIINDGWEIQMIDLTKVIARYKEEEKQFQVTEYNRLFGRDDLETTDKAKDIE